MNRDIIVIGASAGGVTALQKLAASLPADFAPSVFVVLHAFAKGPRLMADILNRAGDIQVSYPENGEAILPNHVYIAPPDYHLLLEQGTTRVVRGPKENGRRPSVDSLFRSAAVKYGPRVIGVVLTGYLDDGTVGLNAIKECGGIAVVQDPADAEIGAMPANALQHVEVDYCLTLAEIPELLQKLTSTPIEATHNGMEPPENLQIEAR